MWQKRLLLTSILLGAVTALTPDLVSGQQPDPVIESLQSRVDVFFENVKSKNVGKAYTDLFRSGELGSEEDRAVLVEQTTQIEEKYGAYHGFERVFVKRVGSDLVFMKYLYKCDRFPVLWHITFYRSAASGELGADSQPWKVVSIRFDTNLDILTLLPKTEQGSR